MKKPSLSPSEPGAGPAHPVRSAAPLVPLHYPQAHSPVGTAGLQRPPRAKNATPFRWGRVALLSTALWVNNPADAQSLWQAESSQALIADKRAGAVGDLLTILVQENNTASKDNSTKTGKNTSVDASIASFLYSPAASSFLTKNGVMPAMKLGSSQSFDGGGKVSNSERITARITVRVVDVLPNKNLVIEGRRTTAFAGETQEAVLRGVVRPEDIAPNNTLFSYNVADATIKYVSNGTLSDNQRKGWFTRVWEKVNPF